MNSRPALHHGKERVHRIRNLRRERGDVALPIAIVCAREQQLGVIFQDDESHVVDGSHEIRSRESSFYLGKKRAQLLGAARLERNDHCEF